MKSIDQNIGAADDALNDDLFPNGISLDSFDEPAEPHEFSATYQARKAALLGEYRAQQVEAARNGQPPATIAPPQVHVRRKRSLGWKLAIVAAAAALVALPAAGFAVASNADFFANAFGTGARTATAAHDETITQGEKTVTVTYPAREYVDIDPEEAEALLGDHLMTTPVETTMGDHKITVLSVVRDNNSAVLHYTVSREGGVTMLKWDALSNEGKGAHIDNDSPYYWMFTVLNGAERYHGIPPFIGGTIIVNPQRSTADAIDCYEYVAFPYTLQDDDFLTLQVGAREDSMNPENHDLPAAKPLPRLEFTAANGGTAAVSAIGIQIAGITSIGADPGHLNTIEVAFDDGTTYCAYDRGSNLDNTSYLLGRSKNQDFVAVFNRLVNPEGIASITVNGIEFTR